MEVSQPINQSLVGNMTQLANMSQTLLVNMSQQLLNEEKGEKEWKGLSEQQILEESLVISFVFGCLLVGSVFRVLNKKFGIPFTPTIFFLGLICGLFASRLGYIGDSLVLISKINPHGLLQIFLPILVFEAGFNLDWHIFRTELPQILILAFPCVILNAMIMMCSIKWILCYEDTYYTWTGAFMFGSIVSCTDPIAVVALLKELGASKRLNTLIEGESLLNDAVGMVLYQIGASLYKGNSASPTAVIGLFSSLTFGGVLLGLVLGVIVGWVINKLYNDEILVVNITLMGGFVAFFLAETVLEEMGWKISGIMSIISIGVFMAAIGRTKINPEVEHNVHAFWHFLVFGAETTIFILAGVIVGQKVLLDPAGYIRPVDYQKLLGMYGIMNIGRLISLGSAYPLLKTRGYGLNSKEFIVIVYGGLRGAVGIAFAMIAASDEQLDPVLRDIFLFDMSGCAVLTLIINASTCGSLINYFGILNEHRVKDQMYMQFLESMLNHTKQQEEQLKNNSYMNLVDWQQVHKLAGFHSIQKEISNLKVQIQGKLSQEQKERQEQYSLKDKDQLNTLLDKEANGLTEQEKPLLSETRSRYISILQQTYAEQFATSESTAEAYLLLNASVNMDQDRFELPMGSWQMVNNAFLKYHYVRILIDMRKLPIIGGWVRNIVFNQVSYAYSVVVAYIQAHHKAEDLILEFQVSPKLIEVVLEESHRNRELAEHYLHNYLMLTYPEITKSVQTKKAVQLLLEFQKKQLKQNYQTGHIDEKEYQELRTVIDTKIVALQDITPDFQQEDSRAFIQNLAVFDFISDQNTDHIISNSSDKNYDRGSRLMKEKDSAKFVFIILRGTGEETCNSRLSDLLLQKNAGQMVGMLGLVIDNPAKYQTTFIADSNLTVRAIPLSIFRRLVHQNQELEMFIWKQSIYEFIKVNTQHLSSLSYLTYPEVNQLSTLSHFTKFQQGDKVTIPQGCIFLQGMAVQQLKEDYSQSQIVELTNDFSTLQQTKYNTPKLIRNKQPFELFILQTTCIMEFNYAEAVDDLIQESLQQNYRHSVQDICQENNFNRADSVKSEAEMAFYSKENYKICVNRPDDDDL